MSATSDLHGPLSVLPSLVVGLGGSRSPQGIGHAPGEVAKESADTERQAVLGTGGTFRPEAPMAIEVSQAGDGRYPARVSEVTRTL